MGGPQQAAGRLLFMPLTYSLADYYTYRVELQSGWSGCRTGNGKKLSSSQALLG